MLQFKAQQYSGTSVQYSPFVDNWIALGTAANFGIVGNGKVFLLEIANNGTINARTSFDTQDSVFKVAWSEVHENHLVAGCGDGSVQLFDFSRPNHPLVVVKEHQREVFGVNWNGVDKTQFCSCSWDGTIKLWSADVRPLSSLTAGPGIIYEAKFSPRSTNLIASANADGSTRIWDTRSRGIVSTFKGNPSQGECLTTDWNKYRPDTLASANSDGSINIWDMRAPGANLVNELQGHKLAVKSVKWSPHSANHLLSASYDMTAKVWVDSQARVVPSMGLRGLVSEFRNHTEFVTDCDWSLWGQPGWVATTSFDSNVYLWRANLPL